MWGDAWGSFAWGSSGDTTTEIPLVWIYGPIPGEIPHVSMSLTTPDVAGFGLALPAVGPMTLDVVRYNVSVSLPDPPTFTLVM
jgi:hypothetical protein